jgi:hypothetical protein
VAESILRSLEEDLDNPEQLQSSFADAEECAGKSMNLHFLFLSMFKFLGINF